jgi:hypothetical protein
MIDWTAITAVIGSITTVAGTLGGYVAAGRNDENRDKRAASRETEARKDALAERLEEERHNFQRDTFLALQDELLNLVRNSALVTAQDIKTLKEHRKMFLLPESIGGEAARQTVASAERLRTRVVDNELRAAIGAFIALCTRNSMDLRDVPVDEAIRELGRRDIAVAVGYQEIAERLGTHLRMELDRLGN